MSKNYSRREFFRLAGLAAAGAVLTACAPQTTGATTPQVITQIVKETAVVEQTSVVKETQMVESTKIVEVTPIPKAGPTNALGVVLPADALPLDKQYWLIPIQTAGTQNAGATGQEMESLYSRAYDVGLCSEVMCQLDKEGKVVGVACESWKQSADGLNWDFNLRKDLVFDDGAPITAKDWVFTFQRSFGKGYDFGWMYADILNVNDVLAGKIAADQLGIKAVDDYTLRVTTATVTPYIPAVMAWAFVAPKQAYDKYGDNWSVEPEHFIASGPWKLKEFNRGVQWTFTLNTKYKGINRPYITEVRGRSLPTGLNAYINGDIQTYTISAGTPLGEIGMVNADLVLRAESHPGFSNITWYFGFNTLGKFKQLNDPKVRLALNKAVDKTTLVGSTLGGFAYPAWGILPKGFPGNSYNALAKEDPNVFDVAAAQKLLADAGFPKGAGFPTFDLYMRAPGAAGSFMWICCQAVQDAWKKNLGINVKLVSADYPTFNKAAWTDKTAPMYFVAYSMDYWDAATFLNVFRTGSRHPWANKQFDDTYTAANAELDPAKRSAGLAAAEKILVDDCGFVFYCSSFSTTLWPCNIVGDWTIPNSLGYSAIHASPYSGGPSAWTNFYFSNSTCRSGLKQ